MKRFLTTLCLLALLSLSSCQCSNKPDIGPVEDRDQEAARVPGAQDAAALPRTYA